MHNRRIFLINVFILILLSPAFAIPPGQWRLSGIQGTTTFGMILHEGQLFGGTAGKGIYSSSDGGKTWTEVNNGLTNLTVRAFVSKEHRLFAATKDGVFMTSDRGKTWVPRNQGMEPNSSIYSMLEVSGILLAGTKAGIYRSDNEGNSWTLVTNGFSGMPYVYGFCSQSNYIFAGTESNSVMKSGDGGLSWTPASNGIPPGMTVSSFFVVNDKTLLCGSDGAGCFLSVDQGNTWTSIKYSLTNDRIFGLSQGNNALYAASVSTVFKSTDKGNSWESMPMNGWPDKAYINSILADKDKLFISTDLGIYYYEEF